jgi:CubicO group peptidase (beta-lactamase class C family)/beta-glucosidase-like glycosyl hydrolase
MVKKVFLSVLFISCFAAAWAQPAREQWVDSVFATLNADEKIGQLLMPRVRSLAEADLDRLQQLIEQYHIGGLAVTNITPVAHVSIANRLQALAKVPLLVGLAPNPKEPALLDSMPALLPPLVLSATHNDSLVYSYGRWVAQQLKQLGIHVYFGPQADIHLGTATYPHTLQYFGETKETVARHAWSFTQGLQHDGILAVVTHPAENQVKVVASAINARLTTLAISDSVSFYPYQKLIEQGVAGILTSHIHYASANGTEVMPPALSQLYISDLIKKKLGFKGLVFTEIPLLQHWVEKPRAGETETLAIQVANDVLLDPQSFSATVRNVKKLLKKDKAFAEQLDETVRKILGAKYEAGLAHGSGSLPLDNLVLRLHPVEGDVLKRAIIRQSITVVHNEASLVPISQLDDRRFALVTVGAQQDPTFFRTLKKYVPFDLFELNAPSDTLGLLPQLQQYDVVVAGIYPLGSSLLAAVLPQLYPVRQKTIVVQFGDPKQLFFFQDFVAAVAAYTADPWQQQLTAQLLFGAFESRGKLPVAVSARWPEGSGAATHALQRLAYALPEEAGIDSKTLEQIEDIAREAIDSGATPGCHVLVARHGKVIYDRSFGWHTYENQRAVTEETIYDLASVTKVSATLQALMFLYERGMIDLDKKASVYLPELRNSNKKDFTLRDILTHQAGLWPFLPFWADTMKDSVHMPEYYSFGPSEAYPFQVSENLFASVAMKDSLWNWIVRSKVRPKVNRTPYDYRYSDMGFYIFQHLAERLLNQPLEEFLAQNLYEPLGAHSLGYLPLQRFAPEQIAPTENDTLFRKSLLVGHVHDQGAAMHGGVAGHAGLFGNANDLAKLAQLWLNGGTYGGEQFYKPETVATFAERQFETSRRGLGWDKPLPSDWNSPTSLLASGRTFGHTGFTGTCVWVDPTFDLVYIFLSNRVHPMMTNNKLLNANIRPRIQEVIYKAIFNQRQYGNFGN